mgnify:CR=1 FL=1|tara:strand:+ start:969 stop:1853 length:885 start_codon:yes stop_codon:yes gene_type:complete
MKKANLKQISKKFHKGGLLIDGKKIDILSPKIERKVVIKNYHDYGIILFKKFFITPEKFHKFIKKFTLNFANDAVRRKSRFKNTNLRNVDSGNHQIELHSESSFTVTCPEIIWFYCITPPKKNDGGNTKIVDGIKLWEELETNTKKFFLKNPIIFHNKIRLEQKKNLKKQKWFLNKIGSYDEVIDWKNGFLFFKFKKFLVHKINNLDKFVFANHLLSVKQESQIIKCTYENNRIIPKQIMKEVYNKAESLSFHLNWEVGDMIMINNKRFIHGRSKIKKDSKRDIINAQSLNFNF